MYWQLGWVGLRFFQDTGRVINFYDDIIILWSSAWKKLMHFELLNIWTLGLGRILMQGLKFSLFGHKFDCFENSCCGMNAFSENPGLSRCFQKRGCILYSVRSLVFIEEINLILYRWRTFTANLASAEVNSLSSSFTYFDY